jgi:hypothetical protein
VQFAAIALELVKVGESRSCAALASICHDDLNDLFRKLIADRLGQSSFWLQLGGWHLLMSLVDRGVEWASALLHEKWPTDAAKAKVLLFSRGYPSQGKLWLEKITELAPNISPTFLQQSIFRAYRARHKHRWPGPWGHIMEQLRRGHPLRVANRSKWNDMFPSCHIGGISVSEDVVGAFSKQKFSDPDWNIYLAAIEFTKNPNAERLGKALTAVADCWTNHRPPLGSHLPWPIMACVAAASDKDDLGRLAERASAGDLGDEAQWKAAEMRWKVEGLQDEDFEVSEQDWPFSERVDKIGFPFAACVVSEGGDVNTSRIFLWVERLQSLKNTKLREWLADSIISFWDVRLDKDRPLTAKVYKDLINAASKRRRGIFWLEGIFDAGISLPISTEWLEIFDMIGRENTWLSAGNVRDEYVEDILHHFCADPERWKGLLNLVVEFASEGSKCNLPRPVLETIKGWGHSAKEDAIVLSFARDDLSDQEIANLADLIAEQKYVSVVTWRACRVASHTSADLSAKLALAILKVLSPDSEDLCDAIEHARSHLVNFLTKRASNLDSPGIWERLHLPARV